MALIAVNKLWPRNSIPYRIETDLTKIYGPQIAQAVISAIGASNIQAQTAFYNLALAEAIQDFNRNTPIRFLRYPDEWILIGHGFPQTPMIELRVDPLTKRCSTKAGPTDGLTTIGCYSSLDLRKTITHELCHAIGLHHEQRRPDRDNHILIDYNKISVELTGNTLVDMANRAAEYSGQYGIMLPPEAFPFGGYDLFSLLHYTGSGITSLSGGLGATLRTLSPTNNTWLSQGDIDAITAYYAGRN